MQTFRHVASREKSYAIFIDSSPIRWKFCSLKFWSAFLINLEKQLVVNTDFMKKKRIKLWYFESLNGLWWIKYLGLVAVWSFFRNKGHCNFLLTSAIFQKEVLNKKTCVFSISFEEVTCKVSDMSLQGKKRHGIFINSSPIGWKVLSVKFWSVFLTCAKECFMANIVFAKAYMTSFLPMAFINSPCDMLSWPCLVPLLLISFRIFIANKIFQFLFTKRALLGTTILLISMLSLKVGLLCWWNF